MILDGGFTPEEFDKARRAEEFAPVHVDAQVYADLTLLCPVCGRRADVCFDHGDDWKAK